MQAEILTLLRDLRQKFGTALIFITHNPALLIGFADRVAVMYAGRVVEQGSLSGVFGRPLHPYTMSLLDPCRDPGDARIRVCKSACLTFPALRPI